MPPRHVVQTYFDHRRYAALWMQSTSDNSRLQEKLKGFELSEHRVIGCLEQMIGNEKLNMTLLFQCGRISRILIYGKCVTEVYEAQRNWRVVVLPFPFSSINDEISLSSNCFSSFDLSYKLGSIFASHSASSLS